jgi:hypothetical protein
MPSSDTLLDAVADGFSGVKRLWEKLEGVDAWICRVKALL